MRIEASVCLRLVFHWKLYLFTASLHCFDALLVFLCRRWEGREKLIALSYADVILFRCTRRIIHFSPPVPQLIFTATCLIWNPAGLRIACKDVIRSWQGRTAANGRQLHYCLRVTDGWHRWQTRWINWQGYEQETSLRYGSAGVSRCIFSQMSCCTAVCGIWFHMLNASVAVQPRVWGHEWNVRWRVKNHTWRVWTYLFGWLLMLLFVSWWL